VAFLCIFFHVSHKIQIQGSLYEVICITATVSSSAAHYTVQRNFIFIRDVVGSLHQRQHEIIRIPGSASKFGESSLARPLLTTTCRSGIRTNEATVVKQD
jgi:hypothetical protein